ncbi:MAG TPA: KTSC domain-containing protein [Ignavibacteria bacterium]|nr:KTSC domain-containing protein [Ignavibacteria bacterium]
MKMQKVESSNIDEIGYDEENKVLRIAFKHSNSYEYSNFSKEDFEAFVASSSKGSFFYRNILKNYHATKIN